MRFLLRRLGFFALTMWAALTLNFFLPRLMPGNPAEAMMGKFRGPVSPQALKALELAFGVNTHQSLVSQYIGYIGDVATGKFGTSLYFYPASVGRVILDAIPWTLGLVGVTTILVFAVRLQWLPAAFGFDITLTPSLSLPFIGNILQHAALPATALLVTTIGTWILTMRNNMITTLAEDYVRMARAKGLPGRRIMLDYAARNAILPNLTGFAMSLGFVVGGAILVEYVFNYPGVGYMLLQAVNNEDYPLMQALFLLITVTVLVAILLADIATAVFDPRTRTAG